MLSQFIYLLILIVNAKAQWPCVHNISKANVSWRPLPFQNIVSFTEINESYPYALQAAYDELMTYTHNDDYLSHYDAHEVFEANANSHFATGNFPKKKETILRSVYLYSKLAPKIIEGVAKNNCSTLMSLDAGAIVGYGLYLQDAGHFDEKNNATLKKVIDKMNEVLDKCKSFDEWLGFDYHTRLDSFPDTDKLFDSEEWAEKTYTLFPLAYEVLMQLSVPDLRIPERERAIDFIAAVFYYYHYYGFPMASEYDDYEENDVFQQNFYTITHIGFLLSGQGRYPVDISDSKWVYEFLRKNFYAAIKMNDVELVAEIIDNFRQYGCNEENDQQVRDGVSWLVDHYDNITSGTWTDLKSKWGDHEGKTQFYDKMHGPWVIFGALKQHVLEPRSGHYYEILHEALEIYHRWIKEDDERKLPPNPAGQNESHSEL